MNLNSTLFWIGITIVAWLGFRNLISIIIGHSQMGSLKQGQRLCCATSLILYWGACVFAVLYRLWWPLVAGVILELIFRKSVIKSGQVVSKENNE
ncbi:MAG: hypothetical protein IIB56_10640 [Planctomycetes bacterium]|nr:hypothetical protein [Planctomycetota bacterium]